MNIHTIAYLYYYINIHIYICLPILDPIMVVRRCSLRIPHNPFVIVCFIVLYSNQNCRDRIGLCK